MSMVPTHWVQAILILTVYSFLIKDNLLFGAVEYLYVGMGAGYTAVMGIRSIQTTALDPLLHKGDLSSLLPLILGLMVLTKWWKPVSYLSRIPTAIMVAVGAAIALRACIQAELLAQIVATALPLVSLKNWLIVLGTLAVLGYFYFSIVPKQVERPWGFVRATGRLFMMAAFGVGVAEAVASNATRVIGRLGFLFGTWIHIIPQ